MTVAIASGKGGTGKTTVATCLSLAVPERVQLLDCDVEEPNSHFFIEGRKGRSETVSVPIPAVDQGKCTACGKCVEMCRFNALALIGHEVLVFPQLCHSCGGCMLVCPENAIYEEDREIGTLEEVTRVGLQLLYGRLNVGEPMSPPLIRRVKLEKKEDILVVIDSPPGTTCPMMVSVQGADFCLLVTENTPFGLHDLELSVQALRPFGIPLGVTINRADIGTSDIDAFCERERIPVLLKIPFSEKIAAAYSRGIPFIIDLPEYREKFQNMYESIKKMINKTESP